MQDALDLTRIHEEVELTSAKSADAYRRLRVHMKESPHCLLFDPRPHSQRCESGVILLGQLCFGAKAASLVWCRVAAALSRLMQAVLLDDQGRVQSYIDDPLFTLGGPADHSARLFAQGLLV